jgi:hypothetical protein
MTARLVLLLGMFLVLGATPQRPPPKLLDPIEGARQGRALVAEIQSRLSQPPPEGLTNTGVLKIRARKSARIEIPVRFQIVAPEGPSMRWSSEYEATGTNNRVRLTVIRSAGQPNRYRLVEDGKQTELAGNQAMVPFAGSDFWAADLGLEFFSWPEQRMLKTELRRSRSCRVLESLNPQPGPGAYSRVVSWIDVESLGIIYAEAYDSQDKLLKEFVPKGIKKVNGEWQLEEMEMINRQTGSRTRIEFDFDQK